MRMNKLQSFLKLIRVKNLLIIILTQLAIKIYLINSYIEESALSNFDFMIYLLSLISIVAGGYIINDIYDIKIDRINRPTTRIIERMVSKRTAIKGYYILNLLGLIFGMYISLKINKLWTISIFLFFILNLWLYSRKYKTSLLIGNIQVALLTALSIVNIIIFELIPLGNIQHESEILLCIILLYAGFSFTTTLIREVIKDVEDIKGDKAVGANTIAICYGIKKTKNIIITLTTITISCILYFQYFQYSSLYLNPSTNLSHWGVNITSLLYTICLQILFIFLIIKTIRSKSAIDFQFLSGLCKVIMLTGIISIPLFTHLNLN